MEKTLKEIDKIMKKIDSINSKMGGLKKASGVNHVFDKMDKETQEAVKGLINHLMMAKVKKDNKIDE